MKPTDPSTLRKLLWLAPAGDRIEFGVHRGISLALIARHEHATIGVDSFDGMAEPGPLDLVPVGAEHPLQPAGTNPYPRGRFRVSQHDARVAAPGARLVRGWVPDVLADLPEGPYAFARLDLDHYAPTLAALSWLWNRMLPGGVLSAHDWFPHRTILAAGAVNEWAAAHPLSGHEGITAWWIR